jgi:predicted oxidoreductase
MEKRALTAAGPGLSPLTWGTWRLLDQEAIRAPKDLARFIDACLHLGITSFDLADIYGKFGAEEAFGAGLAESGIDRSAVQLVTKCGIRPVTAARPENRVKHYDSSREHILRSVTHSLRVLKTDYLDLLLIHRPDPLMDADETAQALQDVMAKGWVRHVGVSNFSPSQLALLEDRLSVPLCTNQIEFSLGHLQPLEDGTLDQLQQLRIAPMIWSPLAGGNLFSAGEADDRTSTLRRVLEEVREAEGLPDTAATALAWVLRHPADPVAVVGTGNLARLTALAAAAGHRMDQQNWYRLYEAARGAPVP